MADPEGNSPEVPDRMGRGARWLLYGSLLLNVTIIGVLIGALATGGDRRQDRHPPRAGESGFGPIVMALEPKDRRLLGVSMRDVLREERLTRREMRSRMTMLVTILQTEPFERSAVDEILNEQVNEAEFRFALARQLFVDLLSEMSPEDRAAFALRLEAVLEAQRRGPAQNRNGG